MDSISAISNNSMSIASFKAMRLSQLSLPNSGDDIAGASKEGVAEHVGDKIDVSTATEEGSADAEGVVETDTGTGRKVGVEVTLLDVLISLAWADALLQSCFKLSRLE